MRSFEIFEDLGVRAIDAALEIVDARRGEVPEIGDVARSSVTARWRSAGVENNSLRALRGGSCSRENGR